MTGAATASREIEVLGPWSLATSRRFWEDFAPQRLKAADEKGTAPHDAADDDSLTTTFLTERTWQAVRATVREAGDRARIEVTRCDGAPLRDPEAAIDQVARFLSLDIDARSWPGIGERDPIIGAIQEELPGLRPCGFHSPFEAAAWSVLSQRIRVPQAASLRDRLMERLGEAGAFPAPQVLLDADLDLPSRKAEYLRAVARAALEEILDGAHLRGLAPAEAFAQVQEVLGLGPFAAELVVIRGANAPDAVPRNERRLEAEIAERYGDGADLREVSDAWRPLRAWAAVHLRVSREERTGEIATGRPLRTARR